MDTYVRELGTIQDHDQFYVNETLIDAFKNYTTQIVSRYVNSPVLLSWYVSMKSSPIFAQMNLQGSRKRSQVCILQKPFLKLMP